jgi:integrase
LTVLANKARSANVQDVDAAKGRLHIHANAVEVHGQIHVGTTKSHKGRLVPMPTFLVEELVTATRGAPIVGSSSTRPDGGYMRRTRTSDGSKSWLKTALAKAELPLMTIHDLRHTAASLAVQSGANAKTIQRMLGHTSAALTLDSVPPQRRTPPMRRGALLALDLDDSPGIMRRTRSSA